MAVAFGGSADRLRRAASAGSQLASALVPRLEVGQSAVEQVRHVGTGSSGRPRAARSRTRPSSRASSSAMVRWLGRPHFGQVAHAFLGGRRHAFAVERPAVEQGVRIQAGSGGAVQRLVVGRAVEIDHIARIVGSQGAGAQFLGEIVEPGNVPVGIGQRPRLLSTRPASTAGVRRVPGCGMLISSGTRPRLETQDFIHGIPPRRGE